MSARTQEGGRGELVGGASVGAPMGGSVGGVGGMGSPAREVVVPACRVFSVPKILTIDECKLRVTPTARCKETVMRGVLSFWLEWLEHVKKWESDRGSWESSQTDKKVKWQPLHKHSVDENGKKFNNVEGRLSRLRTTYKHISQRAIDHNTLEDGTAPSVVQLQAAAKAFDEELAAAEMTWTNWNNNRKAAEAGVVGAA
jgi:hypothetical protein